MHTQLRLFNTDESWRLRMMENGEETEITKCTIGQARSRNGYLLFLEERLHRTTLNDHVKISDARVQLHQRFQELFLDSRLPLEAA